MSLWRFIPIAMYRQEKPEDVNISENQWRAMWIWYLVRRSLGESMEF